MSCLICLLNHKSTVITAFYDASNLDLNKLNTLQMHVVSMLLETKRGYQA